MTARAELSSVATGLEELAGRISRIAEGLTGADRDLIGSDLYEVERALFAAGRRVNRIIDTRCA